MIKKPAIEKILIALCHLTEKGLGSRAECCDVRKIVNLNQDDMAVDTSGFAVGRCWFVAILLVASVTVKAQNVINEANINAGVQSSDKFAYTLFNPTPTALMREMNADRPDKTDCPFTVDAGHFQIEMDFVNLTDNRSNADRDNVRSTAFEISPMNLKVGLLNNLDFQLVCTAYRWQETDDRNAKTVQRKSGFDGITPRFKLNLVGNDGGFFALALIPFVKLPLSGGHLGDGSVEGGVGVPYSFDIPGWDVGFQTTFHFNRNEVGGGNHTEVDNSVSIGHSLIGKLSLAAEVFSNVSTEGGRGWVGTVDAWLTYQVEEHLRFDGGSYIGMTLAADDLHLWLGMTWRF